MPSGFTSIGGSIRSGTKYRLLAATSPGSVKPGQRGEMEVVRAADAAFEHAAVPQRDAAVAGELVHRERRAEAAHPPGLDVDDAARAELERVGGDFRAR